jgi:hypothetical protein
VSSVQVPGSSPTIHRLSPIMRSDMSPPNSKPKLVNSVKPLTILREVFTAICKQRANLSNEWRLELRIIGGAFAPLPLYLNIAPLLVNTNNN